VTVQRISCHHQGVIDDTEKLLQALGWQGIAGVQFHYDPVNRSLHIPGDQPALQRWFPTVVMAGFDASFLLWQSHFEPEKMLKGATASACAAASSAEMPTGCSVICAAISYRRAEASGQVGGSRDLPLELRPLDPGTIRSFWTDPSRIS